MKIIVSLTSYPPRIKNVHKVIKSILKQNIKVDKIILWLSIDEFPLGNSCLPVELKELNGREGFEIQWVNENLKSHKKYFYVLQEYAQYIVITVDDDKEYHETLIYDLIKSHQKFPNAIVARCARIIIKENTRLAPYQNWDLCLEEDSGKPRKDLCAIGAGGILYPPFCASDKWFEKKLLLKLAENQDDLWLKYNEVIDNIPTIYTLPSKKDLSIVNEKGTTLSKINLYGEGNDLCLSSLYKYANENKLNVFINWISELKTKEEYEINKKKKYLNNIRKTIDDMGTEPIYIFGAGKLAQIIVDILTECKITSKIEGILVSQKKENPEIFKGIKVKQLNEIKKTENINVILGVNKVHQKEVYKLLKSYKCQCFELNIQGIKHLYN